MRLFKSSILHLLQAKNKSTYALFSKATALFSFYKKECNRQPSLIAFLLSLLCIPAIASDGIVVIPGKNAVYLYNPANKEVSDDVSLHLVKEGNYINYRIESDPAGLLCDENCKETVQRLPSGEITLNIIGEKPFPLMKIPLRGIWTEGCNNPAEEAESCEMNLNEINSQVKVEVDPNVVAGTLIPMPGEGFEVMFISADTSRGYAVVALHHALGPKVTWLDFDPSRRKNLGINSLLDGASNSAKMLTLDSAAAKYCAEIDKDLAGGWHLPASGEIAPITSEALNKIPGLDKKSYLWTSTEQHLYEGKQRRTSLPYLELQISALKTDTAGIERKTAYSYDQQADGSWKEDSGYTGKYQILCVAKVPL